jgi:AmmeMemoRadiSam system protein A
MPSSDSDPLSRAEPRPHGFSVLKDVALRALAHGVRTGRPLAIDPGDHPPDLRTIGATFVTLRIGGELRGCIGSIEAAEPLIVSAAHNAFRAGFHDPRFPPISERELSKIEVEVSVLSPLEPMPADSEEALIAALRPGRDGIVLREGDRVGTFLPSVWEQLPEPRQFLRQLKHKAGLPAEHWSDRIRVWRYTTEKAG